ncbi:LysE family translocator [Acidisoma cellulosilytica]|uniref:LysE family translocator n=1 Tax=Acidisoma cellulosilyticum TaxID=2802395 RepID=A0A963Z0A0_9PROT|nr:LysE family translocator [Acidisoma cellulosilyticum]MCB8879473.1 LysE family translocator [Acidisoma cellulosilyticum]
MDWHLYCGFVGVTLILGCIPGPNVALIVANSVAHGVRYGLATVAGTVSAQVIQLIAVSLGLTALLESMGVWFTLLRWVGVVYLLYLGYRQWRAPAVDLSRVHAGAKIPLRSMLPRAAAVSLTNPKVLLFLGALFPQFIAAHHAVLPQVALLALTFLVIIGIMDSGWAIAAGRARRLLSRHARLRNRLSGGMLMAAAAGLAVAHKR